MTAPRVTEEQVRRFRLRANHLERRLPAGSLAEAAFAGLQDTAPRAALMALHARVEAVSPPDWENPALVQTWAPRAAVHVVPARDLWVFALGIRPRSRAAATSDRLRHAMAGDMLRWDTRTSVVIPGREPDGDPEAARLELAWRYLRSLGPGGAAGFTRYAAVGPQDALTTFGALAGELVQVDVLGRGPGCVLGADLEALLRDDAVSGARLLPAGGDPILQPGEGGLFGVGGRGGNLEVWGIDLPGWCVGGALLLDGEVVGAYGRRLGQFALVALTRLGRGERDSLEAEAWAAPIPGGVSRVEWRPQ